MKISIAMATYNGAKYLQEQLDSFVAQTRQPDELVVCDDGSSDATLETLRQFAAVAPFKVSIHENKSNLGYAKNFEKVISLCCGDIISLSDQDDVWLERKLAEIEQVFLRNPGKMVVINDQIITDGKLRHSGVTKLENTRRLALGDSWFVTGCCTALRREWVDFVVPIPSSIAAHDVWINRLADSIGLRLLLEEPLQMYRRHGSNISEAETSEHKKVLQFKLLKMYGLRDSRPGWQREIRNSCDYTKRLEEHRTRLAGLTSDKTVDEALLSLKEKREALARRIELASVPRWRRWLYLPSFWFSGGYRQFASWKSAVKDLIRP